MRHRKKKLTLNRYTSWRRATLIDLSRSLLIHQRIRTSKTKAKAAMPLVEKLITLGKRDNLISRRKAFSFLQDHKLVQLLFSEIAPLFKQRDGGFCRILTLGFRRGDGARSVIFELTEKRKEKKKTVKKEKLPQKPKAEPSPEPPVAPKVEPPKTKKPTRKFLGGLRKIFRKERNSS